MADGSLFILCRSIFILSLLVGKNSADDDGVDEKCFDESCGRKYDPGCNAVTCKLLFKAYTLTIIFLSPGFKPTTWLGLQVVY